MRDIYYRYFVFSRTQMDDIRRRNAKLGREVEFGTVVVGGVKKEYTDILISMDQVKYPDSIKVAEGDIRFIGYKKVK